MKSKLLYHIVFFTLLIITSSCDKNIDWSANYNKEKTTPYGAKSVYELVPKITGEKFEQLKKLKEFCPKHMRDSLINIEFEDLDSFENDSVETYNLSMVKNYLQLSNGDLNAMDLAIRNGAHVLLAANDFSSSIKDAYGFEMDKNSNNTVILDTALINYSTVKVELSSTNEKFKVRKGAINKFFKFYSLIFKSILLDQDNNTIALRQKIGKGSLTLCSTPKLFTNFHLLHTNPKLVEYFYQEMPKQQSYWGNTYNSVDWKSFKQRAKGKTILDFVKKYSSLTWGWYLLLLGGLLYLLSNMRRLQKPMKPLKENKNLSLEYVRTVAQLYRKSSDHSEILRKKIEIFYGAIYERYDISRSLASDEKAKKIFIKTGKKHDLKELKKAFNSIDNQYLSTDVITDNYAVTFKRIEELKSKLF